MNRVIVVVGPTSVGKTKMGIELAKAMNGEIISGDSMQIYKGMDIGTAKVTFREMEGIPHHCIDIKDPKDSYSVKEFQTLVRQLINEIELRHHTPIIVGGTGLYVKAALYDYQFNDEHESRDDHIEKYSHYSNEELYEHLKKIDEKSALQLHQNNRRRILRAIEIYENTGQKKSEIIERQKHKCLYDAYFVGLTIERSLLHQRINDRVDLMKRLGLEDEVHQLYQKGLTRDYQSMKGIGYKEWFDYFDGKITKDEVYENIKLHTRQYAKRQYTWFKNQFDVRWYDVDLNCFQNTVTQVLQDLSNIDDKSNECS